MQRILCRSQRSSPTLSCGNALARSVIREAVLLGLSWVKWRAKGILLTKSRRAKAMAQAWRAVGLGAGSREWSLGGRQRHMEDAISLACILF